MHWTKQTKLNEWMIAMHQTKLTKFKKWMNEPNEVNEWIIQIREFMI